MDEKKLSQFTIKAKGTGGHGSMPHKDNPNEKVLNAAHAAHPDRFVRQPPRPLTLPREVWINPPADGPKPRMLQLPRDTNFVQQVSQIY